MITRSLPDRTAPTVNCGSYVWEFSEEQFRSVDFAEPSFGGANNVPQSNWKPGNRLQLHTVIS